MLWCCCQRVCPLASPLMCLLISHGTLRLNLMGGKDMTRRCGDVWDSGPAISYVSRPMIRTLILLSLSLSLVLSTNHRQTHTHTHTHSTHTHTLHTRTQSTHTHNDAHKAHTQRRTHKAHTHTHTTSRTNTMSHPHPPSLPLNRPRAHGLPRIPIRRIITCPTHLITSVTRHVTS